MKTLFFNNGRGIFLAALILSFLSCGNNDVLREEALKESGKILMEEPEMLPIVQTLHDLDAKLQDIDSSLRGEGGDLQDSIESFNSSLIDTQNQIRVLRKDLESGLDGLEEVSLSYEALADNP